LWASWRATPMGRGRSAPRAPSSAPSATPSMRCAKRRWLPSARCRFSWGAPRRWPSPGGSTTITPRGRKKPRGGARGRVGESRAVSPLVGGLSDGSREVRVAALDALGELGDAKAAPAMIRLLNDNADEVRAQAIQSLGRLKARAAVGPLAELLERGAEP